MKKIEFEIDGINYEIPEKLTIEKYVEIMKVKDIFEDEYFSAKLLNITTGAPIDKLLKINYNVIEKLSHLILLLFPQDKKFYNRFELNGVDYGFMDSWEKISFAEYVDLDTLFKKKDNQLLDMIHIITAIMYRPIKREEKFGKFMIEDYDSDQMLERAELFKKELDIKYFYSGQFFFGQFRKKWQERIQQSLLPPMKKRTQLKILWKMRKIIWNYLFKKDSDGTQLLIDSQMMILRNTMKLPKKRWWKR